MPSASGAVFGITWIETFSENHTGHSVGCDAFCCFPGGILHPTGDDSIAEANQSAGECGPDGASAGCFAGGPLAHGGAESFECDKPGIKRGSKHGAKGAVVGIDSAVLFDVFQELGDLNGAGRGLGRGWFGSGNASLSGFAGSVGGSSASVAFLLALVSGFAGFVGPGFLFCLLILLGIVYSLFGVFDSFFERGFACFFRVVGFLRVFFGGLLVFDIGIVVRKSSLAIGDVIFETLDCIVLKIDFVIPGVETFLGFFGERRCKLGGSSWSDGAGCEEESLTIATPQSVKSLEKIRLSGFGHEGRYRDAAWGARFAKHLA